MINMTPPTISKPLVPEWLIVAQSYIGLHEGTTLCANPKVVKFFIECGHAEETNDHTTPWCAAFVGAVLQEAHLPNTGSLLALSYSDYGEQLVGPIIGAIGIKRRPGTNLGHVFFVVGFDKSHVWALGGNQNDQVCIERIPRSVIFAYRWPSSVPIPTAHNGFVAQ